MYGSGTVAGTTKGKNAPRILSPALEGGRNLIHPPEQWLLAVCTALLLVKPLAQQPVQQPVGDTGTIAPVITHEPWPLTFARTVRLFEGDEPYGLHDGRPRGG